MKSKFKSKFFAHNSHGLSDIRMGKMTGLAHEVIREIESKLPLSRKLLLDWHLQTKKVQNVVCLCVHLEFYSQGRPRKPSKIVTYAFTIMRNSACHTFISEEDGPMLAEPLSLRDMKPAPISDIISLFLEELERETNQEDEEE